MCFEIRVGIRNPISFSDRLERVVGLPFGGRQHIGDLSFQAEALSRALALDGCDRSLPSGKVESLGGLRLIQSFLKLGYVSGVDGFGIAQREIVDRLAPSIAGLC